MAAIDLQIVRKTCPFVSIGKFYGKVFRDTPILLLMYLWLYCISKNAMELYSKFMNESLL